MEIQDWKPVTFVKKNTKPINKKKNTISNIYSKVDNTEIAIIKKVKLSVSRVISKKRTELKISQKELAIKLNVKPEIIISYENGKAIPNGHLLNKLQKILGIYLSGKKIGQSITYK